MKTQPTDVPGETTIKEAILELIRTRDYVSFAELSREIPNFEGDGIEAHPSKYENIVFWCNLSKQAFEAMMGLLAEEKIFMHPSSTLVYLVDGCALRLPIAKRSRNYKTPHWLPVTFCTHPWKKNGRAKRDRSPRKIPA